MDGIAKDGALRELEERLAAYDLRGQWQMDANRPQNAFKGERGQLCTEPLPSGAVHLWQWDKMLPLLKNASEVLTESFTARRTLALMNPVTKRGTTHTLVSGIQIIRPGEIAWGHRHTINALRFTIQGATNVYTVVDGQALTMEPYDLVLTPGWCWHDHHNESASDAIWLDVLDVPFTLMLNQSFYEELGEISQKRETPLASQQKARRYPWQEMRLAIEAAAAKNCDAHDGTVVEYTNPETGGSVLPTLSCTVQRLPPGFEGELVRRTSSAISFVIEGTGATIVDGREIAWNRHDSFTLPNWIRYRHVNRSDKAALLFTVSDKPILQAFGLYEENFPLPAGTTTGTGQ
jgi:1-hydroxy-2-naphthoate dioxygenase